MDRQRRSDVQEAAAVLMVNCPYNRASFQLPIAMQSVVARYNADQQHNVISEDWRRLQQGLTMHVQVLDALGGGQLLTPLNGDHLMQMNPALVLDRGQLATSPDPVGDTLALLEQVGELVEGYDMETMAKIEAASGPLAEATGDQWTLKLQIIGWRAALQRMEPFAQDAKMKADIRQMIEAMDAYVRERC